MKREKKKRNHKNIRKQNHRPLFQDSIHIKNNTGISTNS